MGIRQTIDLVLGETTKRQLEADFKAAAGRGATALKAEFERKLSDNRVNLAEGIISEREFKAANQRVADSLKATIITRMRELQDAGKDTGREYTQLGGLLRKVSTDGAGSINILGKAWSSIKSTVIGLGASIAAAFTVRAIIDFARESVKAAAEAESAWSELGVSLGNVGVDLGKVRDQISGVADEIMATTRFGDESVLRGLNILLQLTKDYDKSLRALGPIADFAAAKHMSFEQAAEIVGKAIAGNDRELRRYIPSMEKGGDAIQALAQFHGAAAAELDTFAGAQARLSNLWGEFQEAIGNALIASAEGTSVMEDLSTVVQAMTRWVQENRDEIAKWGAALIRFAAEEVRIFFTGVGNVFRFFQATFDPNSNFWRGIRIGLLQFGQMILGAVLQLQHAMLDLSRALPGDPFADQIQRAMERTSGYIGTLGREIAEQSAGMKRDLGADDPEAVKTTSLGGGHAANVRAGADKATQALTKEQKEAQRIAAEMAEAHRRAQAQNLAVTTEVQEAIQSAYIQSGEAAERGGIMSQEAARATAEVAAEVRNAQRNYAEEYWNRDVPLFLQGQQKQQEALEKTGETGKAAGEEGKSAFDKWLDSMHVLESALDDLGAKIGGTLGNLISGIGSVTSGITAAAAGFNAFKNTTETGLLGLIQRVAGLAGGFGGVISVAAALPGILKSAANVVGDIISGIGGILGIHGSKDPGRIGTNREAREFGARNPTGIYRDGLTAIEWLYKMSGRSGRPGSGYGGREGWGSKGGQDDAWAQLQALLRDLQNVGRLPERYRGLLGASGGGTQTSTSGSGLGSRPPTTTSPNTGPLGSNPVPSFQTGGLMPWTGLAKLHAGELVLPPRLTRDLSALLTGVPTSGGATVTHNASTDNRALSVVVNLPPMAPDHIPAAVVRAIRMEIGKDYQRQATLAGNSRIGG